MTIVARDGVDRLAHTALDGASVGPTPLQKGEAIADRVLTGEAVPFADLGLHSRSFDGRVLRDSLALRPPQDAFAADYDNVELTLDFAYAAGLERGAQIIIRVNGATVLGLPLTKPAGAVERNRTLRVPLSAFAGPGVDMTLTGSVDAPAAEVAPDPLASFSSELGRAQAGGDEGTSIVRRLLSMGSPVPVATSRFDPANSSALISQAISPVDGDAVWTVVTGATYEDIRSGVEALTDPSSIEHLDGATASFSDVDGMLTSSIAKGRYVPARWTTFTDTRRVLQGWFAQNQHVYAALMLLLLGGLGLVTNLCVSRTGYITDDTKA